MSERIENQMVSWNGSAVYGRAPGVILRAIADQSLLVPVQGGLADLQQIYALHGVGACIWEHLDGSRTLDDVLAAVLNRFEVTAGDARADISAFIASLASSKLVERRL
jgi:Coenzyme PQQ synthesis protein D (PqqD)